jgi:hypothetical protein
MFREMRFTKFVKHFRKAPVVAGFVQEMRRAECNGGVFVFRQIIVREDDDSRLLLRGRQRAHDAESRPLLQMQVQDDHVDRVALDRRQRRRFGVCCSDQLDIGDLANRLRLAFGQDFRVLDQQYPQRPNH